MKRNVRLVALLMLLAIGGTGSVGAEIFCRTGTTSQDPRVELLPTTKLPWGAVGYLDNGCTATLLDASHVLAAAHCFTDDDHSDSTPGWQDNVYFVPNFHPSTASTATFHRVDRAVVGTRLNALAPAELDWGIGHLATNVAGKPTLALADAPVSLPFAAASAGYGRDRNRVQPGGKRPAGPACGNDFCGGANGGPNVWWDNALVDPACSVRFNTASGRDNWLFSTCATVGGNSGSPVVSRVLTGRSVVYRVVGVIRGGYVGPDTGDADSDNDKNEAKPYSQANVSPPCQEFKAPATPGVLNDGPAAQRFRFAPLHAEDVAVLPVAAGVKRSVVFAADGDASRIVVRERKGTKVTGGFATYRFDTFLLKPTRLAGFLQPNGNPALAAVTASGKLFVRLSQGEGQWPYWKALDLPPGVTSVRDVDGLEGGTGELYVLAANGTPYARRLDNQTWSAWRALGGGGYTALAAVKDAGGRRLLFFAKSGPNVFSLSWRRQTGTSWTSPFSGATAFGGKAFRAVDVDAVRDAQGVLHLLGIDRKTGLWERKTYGKPTSESGWGDWAAAAHLFIPALADKTKPETTGPWLEGAASLTASRWAEQGTAGVPGLVALVVDARGNVHQTTLVCAGTPGPCSWRALRAFTE